jgi:hypothetical protein
MKYLSNDVLLLSIVFSALHLKQGFSLDIKSSCSVSSLIDPKLLISVVNDHRKEIGRITYAEIN